MTDDDTPMQQNPDGSWSPAKPLPFLGEGVDWECYEMHAIGYIGFDEVARVHARSRTMLRLKMWWAGRRYRHTPQISGGHDD